MLPPAPALGFPYIYRAPHFCHIGGAVLVVQVMSHFVARCIIVSRDAMRRDDSEASWERQGEIWMQNGTAALTVVSHIAGEDDGTLIRQACADPAAFERLYQRYADRVYAYLRAHTATPEDAADLTQHVFLHALKDLPRFRGQGAGFPAWLFRIARNAATDLYRRRRSTVALDFVPEALQPTAEQDLEMDVLRREALDRVRALIRTLDGDTRELLALRFAGRLTVGEIAAVIGKSEAATRKKLSRTIQGLKEHYDDDVR